MNCAINPRGVKALILDVDGVLTDGRIGYQGETGDEIKFFDVKDGHAIKLLMRAGLKVGVITGRESTTNLRRARELGLSFIYQKALVKMDAFKQMLVEQELDANDCVYIGDDVIDIPVMRACRIGVAVGDATPETIAAADAVTIACGGRGAIREVAIWLLQELGLYEQLMARYLQS